MRFLRIGVGVAAAIILAIAILLRTLGLGPVAEALEALSNFLGPDATIAALATAAVTAVIDAVVRIRELVEELRRRRTHVTPPTVTRD